MAKGAGSKKDDLGGASGKERNSADPMESLKLIINEHSGLKLRVLQAIKNHLALRDQTLFDVGKEKSEKKGKND